MNSIETVYDAVKNRVAAIEKEFATRQSLNMGSAEGNEKKAALNELKNILRVIEE